MQIPLSARLKACADLIPSGARLADIGADHGYLGIYCLKNGIAAHVTATDVREQPLASARSNAHRFGVEEQMDFVLCDGLSGLRPDAADTFVLAGMGGDTMARILRDCPWAENPALTWVFQPNTSANDLRRKLSRRGWRIERDQLVQEGGFLYNLLRMRFGGGAALTPGEQYVSPELLAEGGALLPAYFARVLRGLERAAAGIRHADRPELQLRLDYYETACREVCEMRDMYANRAGD